MKLCSNRPEGFGPHSNIHPSLPTTCFLSVIVVPAATWLYLLVAVPIIALSVLRSRRTGGAGDGSSPLQYRSVTSKRAAKEQGIAHQRQRAGLARRVLRIAYYVLAVCMLAMVSLQIARLSVAHLGIGLLPFTYVRVLLGVAVFALLRERVGMLGKVVSGVCWVALAVAMALLLAALTMEEGPRYNRVGVAGKYPLGDEVTDVGTMTGVALVLAVLEVVA